MSKIKNDGLGQYGTEPFEQQQFGTAVVEGVNILTSSMPMHASCRHQQQLQQQRLTSISRCDTSRVIVAIHGSRVWKPDCANFIRLLAYLCVYGSYPAPPHWIWFAEALLTCNDDHTRSACIQVQTYMYSSSIAVVIYTHCTVCTLHCYTTTTTLHST